MWHSARVQVAEDVAIRVETELQQCKQRVVQVRSLFSVPLTLMP